MPRRPKDPWARYMVDRDLVEEYRKKGQYQEALRVLEWPEVRPRPELAAWCRFGLGQAPQPKDPPGVHLAHRLLQDPSSVPLDKLRKNSGLRRVLETYRALMDGRFAEIAEAPAAVLPPKSIAQDAWRGLALAGLGRRAEAARALAGGPERPLADIQREVGEEKSLSGPAHQYARALQEGDPAAIARAAVPGACADPTAARIAAAVVLANSSEHSADRALAGVEDPFLRALWRARLALTPPLVAWQKVGLAATGWRASAAPLAFLRASLLYLAIGLRGEARRALALAGPEATRFVEEHRVCTGGNRTDALVQVAILFKTAEDAWIAATKALVLEQRWPRIFEVAVLASKAGFNDAWVVFSIALRRARNDRDTAAIAQSLRTHWGTCPANFIVEALSYLGAHAPDLVLPFLSQRTARWLDKDWNRLHWRLSRRLPPSYWTPDRLVTHIRTVWIPAPRVLANSLDGMGLHRLKAITIVIEAEPDANRRLHAHVALAEACAALGWPLPEATAALFARGPVGGYGPYVRSLFGKRRPPVHTLPRDLQEARQRQEHLYRMSEQVIGIFASDSENSEDDIEEMESRLEELPTPSGEAGPRTERTARDAASAKAKRKAEKKARKKQRGRR